MQTLYEKKPKVWDGLEAAGYKNVAQLARRVRSGSEMDRALGYRNGAQNWIYGASRPSWQAESRAGDALNSGMPAANDTTVPSGLLMVVAPDPAKATRVLQLLGCKVTEL